MLTQVDHFNNWAHNMGGNISSAIFKKRLSPCRLAEILVELEGLFAKLTIECLAWTLKHWSAIVCLFVCLFVCHLLAGPFWAAHLVVTGWGALLFEPLLQVFRSIEPFFVTDDLGELAPSSLRMLMRRTPRLASSKGPANDLVGAASIYRFEWCFSLPPTLTSFK